MKFTKALAALFFFASAAFGSDTPGTVNYPTALDTIVSLFGVANDAGTTLNGSVTAAALSINVASTATFPTSGAVSIDDEVIYYTGKTATSFTGLIRGRDGTAAAAHASGSDIEGRLIARHHSVLRDALIAIETKIGSADSSPTLGKFLVGNGAGSSAWRTLESGDVPSNAADTSGNAATASALAGSPTQCGANNFSTGIAASGNANCAQPSAANLSDGTTGTGKLVLDTSPTLTTPNIGSATGSVSGNAGTASASDHSITACGASNWVTGLSTAWALTCAQPGFGNISGTADATQIPSLDASKIGSGQLALARGGTGADLSATGGASKVLQQTTLGGNVTVGQLAASDLSNGTTGTGALILAGNPSFTANVDLPITTSASVGVVTKGGVPFIHNYAYGSGFGIKNTFVGVGAGNFTMGSTAGHNVGVGDAVLSALTTGIYNTAVGANSLDALQDGGGNTAVGESSLTANVSGANNTAVGMDSMLATTGGYNTAFGASAGATNASGSQNTFLGNAADASVGTLTNAMAIGSGAIVDASNRVVIGNDSVTSTLLKGNVGIGGAPSFLLDATKDQNATTTFRLNNGTVGASARARITTASDVAFLDLIAYSSGNTPANLATLYSSGNSEFRVWNYAATPMTFFTNNSERMRIDSSGNVGIGASVPASLLHVQKDLGATVGLSQADQLRVSSGVSGHVAGLHLTDGITSDGFVAFVPSATASARYISLSAGNAITDLVVNGSGNVGIGTANPGFLLEVAKTGGGVGRIAVTDGAASNQEQVFLAYDTSNDYSYIQSVHQNVAYTDLALQPSGGNVGIGVAVPSAKLEVDGAIKSSGAITERGYSVPMGEWSTFTPTLGASSGTFSGCTANTARYMLLGKTISVALNLTGCSVSATPAYLTVTIPGSYLANVADSSVVAINDNGTRGFGYVQTNGGNSAIKFYKDIDGVGSWATATGTTEIKGTITIEIQ